MEQEGLLFPKPVKGKKKRKKHRVSIMHDKGSRTCYLCIMLHEDYRLHSYLEEHHIFGGYSNRDHSEEYGLKVYLCDQHHLHGSEAVHMNASVADQLHAAGQQAFMDEYPDKNFLQIFGKNFI